MNKPPPPADFDENPEWTEEDFARARPASEILPPHVVAALLQPPHDREQVLIDLDREVLKKFRATGVDWQERINAALRAAASNIGEPHRSTA